MSQNYYGCGETYSRFNLSGEKVRIFVAEHQNSGRIGKKIIREKLFGVNPDHTEKFSAYESYYAQPTFVASDISFVHAKTDCYAEFDFTKKGSVTLLFHDVPELYTGSAESYAVLSEQISSLLGRQRRLPEWIYDGMILAVQGGMDTVAQKIDQARKSGISVNGIWSQDWCGCRVTKFGYQVMWNWEADTSLYHDLKEKIAEWNAEGIRFLGYINPFMAIEKELYAYAAEHGYCVKDREGKDYLVTITTFPAAMIDFTNPEAYEWYKSLIKENMIGIGMSGWMADFGEYLPTDCVLYSGENPEKIHNTWPAIWARMNREAIEECGKEEEVFFFTRAGHTGTISASSMMWTGDQHVDWSVDDGLPSVIPATLSLAMSGYGITHSDAGGYTTVMHMKRSKELMMRWCEMNIFSPLLRTHEGNQPVNNVQFDSDPDLLAYMAFASELHAKLKPYLQACVEECVKSGHPVMRPLFYHYSGFEDEKSQYLLGRDLLVAPVLREKADERSVVLPDDEWIEASTGREYQGGVISVQAPVGKPPVFIRAASPYKEQLLEIIQGTEEKYHGYRQ